MKAFCVFAVLTIFVAACSVSAVSTGDILCSCNTTQGMVDLSPLASKTLRASDSQGSSSFLYSPCMDNNTSPCQDAMVCKTGLMKSENIGKSSGEQCTTRNGEPAIEYPGDSNKTSVVVLKCDQTKDGDLTVVDDSDDTSYVFELASKYACVGGPASTTTTKKTTTPKGTKTTTSKGTKTTTPKGTKTTTPKGTKTTSKVTKTTSKVTKTTPKTTKTTPKGTTKTTSKGPTKTTPKGPTKTTPGKPTKTTPKVPKTTPGGAASHGSISLAALTILALAVRQMF